MYDNSSYERNISVNLQPYDEPQKYTKGTEYGNCFYSNLFMFLFSHKKDIRPYIANNIFSYNYKPAETDLRAKYGIIENLGTPLDILYERSGINVLVEFIDIKNVQSIIKEKINKDKPCCVPVDMYYLPFRIDRYNKIHSDHYILIYGYNNQTNQFYIIDNPQNDYYYKLKMDFNDFYLAYNSAAVNSGGKLTTFKNLSKYDQYAHTSTDFFSKTMLKNLLRFKDNIYTGLSGLTFFSKEFNYILEDPTIWNNWSTNLFYLVHYHILNRKKSECYAYYKILQNSAIVKNLNEIIQIWAKIRSICLYFDKTKKYKHQMVNSAKSNLLQVLNMEYSFYDNLYQNIP